MHRFVAVLALVLSCCAVALAADGPANNVLLITYDGLRWQEVFGGVDARLLEPGAGASKEMAKMRVKYGASTPEERRERLLPFFWGVVAKQGQVIGDADRGSVIRVTNGRNFSYPGYNELLTGAADPKIDSNNKINNPNVTVLEWLNRQPGFKGEVAAFTSWDVFPFIINAERSGVPVNSGWSPIEVSSKPGRLKLINDIAADMPHYWGNVRYDVITYHAAVEYIRKHRPRVIYVSFGETDDWAHAKNYDQYLDSAHRTDDFIRRLWDELQSIRQYRGKTTLLLSTDHGRGDTIQDWTSHGEKVPGCDRIWFAAMGPGVARNGIVSDVQATQSQFAATAASVLGLDFRSESRAAAPPIALK